MYIYLTSTLPYINGDCHAGHLLEFIQLDCISRYLKNKHGEEKIICNTGLDEFGLKVYTSSKKLGIDTQEYCNKNAIIWKNILDLFFVTPDIFWRTTSKEHIEGVIKAWNICVENGDIYEKNYEGDYCVGCESFKTSKDLVNNKCSDHPHVEITTISEKNYFFKLSKYKEHLLEWLENNEDFLTPSSKLEELKNMIIDIEDISVSRNTTSVPWGILVPNNDKQTIYIWFTALCNYIISAGWNNINDNNFEEKWSNSIQLCGPDNLRFQAVIWQGILASLKLSHTKKLLVHGTILDNEGRKMSKSLGNIIKPLEILETYGLTAIRYYVLSGISTYSNHKWNNSELINLYNSDLANNFGNLINRVNHLIIKFNILNKIDFNKIDKEFSNIINEKISDINKNFDIYNIKIAIDIINSCNNYINQILNIEEPWKKNKTEEEIYNTLNKINWYFSKILIYYQIIFPNKKEILYDVIINKNITILFPKIVIK